MKLISQLVDHVDPWTNTTLAPSLLSGRARFEPITILQEDDLIVMGEKLSVVIDNQFFCVLLPYECYFDSATCCQMWKCHGVVVEVVGPASSVFSIEKTQMIRAQRGGFVYTPHISLTSPNINLLT